MLTQRQLFLNHVAQTSNAPLLLEIEKAEGVYLFGPNGEKYLDLISGISVSNLGHRHPAVVQAIKNQLDQYMHLMVYGEYVQAPQTKLAKLLAENLPEQLQNVYFTNSGAEATEGTLKLAKRYTGRSEIISFKNAYHGSTHGALSVIGSEDFKNAYRPLLPDVKQLRFNNEEDLKHITSKTACVIIEPIQAEAGILVPEQQYLKALRKKCTETGALLILDEVQTGYGRTGKLFAHEHFEIVPDIMTLAKGMGGGMPLGAFISSKKIMDSLTNNPVLGHITTFGGNAVCCAAGLATLETLLKENYIAEVPAKEALFKKHLKHPKIKAFRSKGLLITIEFDDFDFNKAVIDECIKNGVITDWFLFASNCLRIAPPLIITKEEIIKACEIIVTAIETISKKV